MHWPVSREALRKVCKTKPHIFKFPGINNRSLTIFGFKITFKFGGKKKKPE